MDHKALASNACKKLCVIWGGGNVEASMESFFEDVRKDLGPAGITLSLPDIDRWLIFKETLNEEERGRTIADQRIMYNFWMIALRQKVQDRMVEFLQSKSNNVILAEEAVAITELALNELTPKPAGMQTAKPLQPVANT